MILVFFFGHYKGKWYRKDDRKKTLELITDVPKYSLIVKQLNSNLPENVKGTIEYNLKKFGDNFQKTLFFSILILLLIVGYKKWTSTSTVGGEVPYDNGGEVPYDNENHEFSNNEYRTPHEIEVENSFFDDTIYHNQTKQVEVGGDDLYG